MVAHCVTNVQFVDSIAKLTNWFVLDANKHIWDAVAHNVLQCDVVVDDVFKVFKFTNFLSTQLSCNTSNFYAGIVPNKVVAVGSVGLILVAIKGSFVPNVVVCFQSDVVNAVCHNVVYTCNWGVCKGIGNFFTGVFKESSKVQSVNTTFQFANLGISKASKHWWDVISHNVAKGKVVDKVG